MVHDISDEICRTFKKRALQGGLILASFFFIRNDFDKKEFSDRAIECNLRKI